MVCISNSRLPPKTCGASLAVRACGLKSSGMLMYGDTGSNGPEGLEEFTASYQSRSLKRSKASNKKERESFREDVSRTGNSSMTMGAQDVPP